MAAEDVVQDHDECVYPYSCPFCLEPDAEAYKLPDIIETMSLAASKPKAVQLVGAVQPAEPREYQMPHSCPTPIAEAAEKLRE